MKTKNIILALLLLLPFTMAYAASPVQADATVQQMADDDKHPLIIVDGVPYQWPDDVTPMGYSFLKERKWLLAALKLREGQIASATYDDDHSTIVVMTAKEPEGTGEGVGPESPFGGKVHFTFKTDGGGVMGSDGKLSASKGKLAEDNISRLLTELHEACLEKRAVDFEGIDIDSDVKRMFSKLWEAHPFTLDNDKISLPVIQDLRGFQVRGIEITEHAKNSEDQEENERLLCISFNAAGQITGINFQVDLSFNKKSPTVTDRRREAEIRQFIEVFRVMYINHDLEGLRNLFADDAIIITGKVTMKRDPHDKEGKTFVRQVRLSKQKKEEYFKNLERTFANNPYIDVKFEDLQLRIHPTRENVYAVNLIQTWNSRSHNGTSYGDVGYLHLLFDFPPGKDPRIHVRAWQPIETPKGEIITIDTYDN